ncbi:MAG TPA: hypothetical protein VGB67_01575 [Fibrella sp.]|jgi:hypothetical protein
MTTNRKTLEQIERLLLNAWSAEYCLRLTPIATFDEDYEKAKAEWVIPQTYYSVLFMVRAYLEARGKSVVAEEEIMHEVDNLIDGGIYPVDGCWREKNGESFLRKLAIYQIADHNATHIDYKIGEIVIAELIESINRINKWHEDAIVDLIGLEPYMTIVGSMPDYLFQSSVLDRTA